jgi:uncharacterized protein (TIGR02145 family)
MTTEIKTTHLTDETRLAFKRVGNNLNQIEMKKISLVLAMLISMVIISCNDSYKEVKIGDQIWMSENLNVDKFRNGDPIPEAKTDEEWEKAGRNGEPAWCIYDNDPANGEKYGKLYNGHAVNDPRGLAPEGWKIPTDEDWSRLTNFLGGWKIAGKKMKYTDFWADKENRNESGNGTNETGFSGLPSGGRDIDGGFGQIGKRCIWWSCTEDGERARTRSLFANGNHIWDDKYHPLRLGLSVRCIRD